MHSYRLVPQGMTQEAINTVIYLREIILPPWQLGVVFKGWIRNRFLLKLRLNMFLLVSQQLNNILQKWWIKQPNKHYQGMPQILVKLIIKP